MFLALSALLIALPSCGFSLVRPGVLFGLDPGTIGYEVAAGEITISDRTMRFWTIAGSPSIAIEHFEIGFYTGGGVLVGRNAGTVGLLVPAGLTCNAPELGCTINSPGARPVEGPRVVSQPFQLLPVAVAQEHIAAGFPSDWYALIQFFGETGALAPFETGQFRIMISTPN
ncbi:MAG: hypothetical protein KGZ35_06285 [Truepera sp.]|nr:hypothetical protein [Truepera sp.]